MPKPYSQDLRQRVIEGIEAGASWREAAELYGISPSVVVIWAQRWEAPAVFQQNRVAAVYRRWRIMPSFCWAWLPNNQI